jgi:hypothetical protein
LKREGVLTIPYQSVEDVGFWVKAPEDPQSFLVEIGLAPTAEEDPASWVTADWTGDVLVNRYFVSATLGPFTQGVRYNVYVRVDGSVVMHSGVIEAF